jgi:hypothetical protein
VERLIGFWVGPRFKRNEKLDEDLALIVANAGITAARQISDILRLIPNEHRDLKLSISSIVYEIQENMIDKIYEKSPNIKLDMERRLNKFERMI